MLEKETNIVQIIKSRRFITEALRELLQKDRWLQLIENSRFICIDPEKMRCIDKYHSDSLSNNQCQELSSLSLVDEKSISKELELDASG